MVMNMRFFKEFHGFFIEFNSLGDYFKFLLGRLVGAILGIGVLFLIGYLLYLYGQTLLHATTEDNDERRADGMWRHVWSE